MVVVVVVSSFLSPLSLVVQSARRRLAGALKEMQELPLHTILPPFSSPSPRTSWQDADPSSPHGLGARHTASEGGRGGAESGVAEEASTSAVGGGGPVLGAAEGMGKDAGMGKRGRGGNTSGAAADGAGGVGAGRAGAREAYRSPVPASDAPITFAPGFGSGAKSTISVEVSEDEDGDEVGA